MEKIKCGFCGGVLLTWTEKADVGVSIFGKCETCNRLIQMNFDEQGDMVDAWTEIKEEKIEQ